MLESERHEVLRTLLDARGWTDFAVVRSAGLMAGFPHRATLAHVRHRETALPGFVKCIWEAAPLAGPETQYLGAPIRLLNLESRLQRIRGLHRVPVVPIADLAIERFPPCLVVVMQPLTPLSDLAPGIANDRLAAAILRRFGTAPGGEQVEWTHTDICPRNAGVDSEGVPFLIDPDSVHLFGSAFALGQSIFFAKWPRSPMWWGRELAEAYHRGDVAGVQAVLLKKQRYEVVLLAAEVSLGVPAAVAGNSADEWLLPWLGQLEGGGGPVAERAAFLRPHLLEAMHGNPNLDAVAASLEEQFVTAPTPMPAQPVVGAAIVDGPGPNFDRHARRMRADQMDEAELREYLRVLAESGAASDTAKPWIEAAILCICYLRDTTAAVQVVGAGMQRFPDDPTLLHWRQMMGLWPAASA